MTTAPYAKLRANIAGSGNLSGALVGAAGATCQLSQDPAGLGSSFLYEITDYPEGFPQPAGWSVDAFGVYFYQGLTPPSFTLPALPLWGKVLPRLTVNNGDPGTSALPATQFIDTSTVISTLDPGGNVEDIAYGESNQWDAQRKWVGPLKRNLRTLAAYAANAGFDLATTGPITLSGEQAVDGVTTNGSRVLVANQLDRTQNGGYLSNAGAWTRVVDMNMANEFRPGIEFLIAGGIEHGGQNCYLATKGPIVVGTTALRFNFSGTPHIASPVDYQKFFPAASILQSIQPMLGVLYDGTLTALGGGTPPVITLTGALVGRNVPIKVACPTTGGALGTWLGTVSYDGGVTVAQTFTSAATVALQGLGKGVVLNIAAGTATTAHTWVAVTNSITDISNHNLPFVQATAAAKPTISPGVLGRVGVSFDGTNQYAVSNLDLPAPATTPTFIWLLARVLSAPASVNGGLLGDGSGVGAYIIALVGSTNLSLANITVADTVTTAAGTWYLLEASFTGSTQDSLRAGSAPAVTGVSSGNNDPSNTRGMGASSTGANKLACEVLACIHMNANPGATALSNARAAVQAEFQGLIAA